MTGSIPPTRSFDVNGLPLTVVAQDQVLLGAACAMLEPFGAAVAPADAWRVEVRYEKVERSWVEDRPLIAQGVDERGLPWRLHYDRDGSAVWVGDRTAARVRLAQRTAEIRTTRGAENDVSITAMIVVLDDFLCAGGQFLTHAACLRATTARDAPAVLLFAPSGTGKTTTALALAHEGLPLVSDDATVLAVKNDRLIVWGLPRATKVHRRTAAMLPWLAPALRPFGDDPEQPVGLASLGRLMPVAEPTPAPLGLIVALERPNPTQHRTRPLDRTVILQHMAIENVRAVDRSSDGVAARRLGMLARAAAAAPALSLSVGPDPSGLGDLLRNSTR